MRRWYALTASLLGALFLGVQGASAQAQQPPLTALADLRDASGNKDRRRIAPPGRGPGPDYLQLPQHRRALGYPCGAHPRARQLFGHGLRRLPAAFSTRSASSTACSSNEGPIAGDLPNLALGGKLHLARYNLAPTLVTLRHWAAASLLNPNGTALVIDSGS